DSDQGSTSSPRTESITCRSPPDRARGRFLSLSKGLFSVALKSSVLLLFRLGRLVRRAREQGRCRGPELAPGRLRLAGGDAAFVPGKAQVAPEDLHALQSRFVLEAAVLAV